MAAPPFAPALGSASGAPPLVRELAYSLLRERRTRRCTRVLLSSLRLVRKPLPLARLRGLHALAALMAESAAAEGGLASLQRALASLPFELAPALLDALDARGGDASDDEAAATYHAVTGLVLLDQPAATRHLAAALASRNTHGHGDAKVPLLNVLAGSAPPPGRVRLEWLRLLRAIAYVDRKSAAAAGAGDMARGLLRGAHPAEAAAERRACEQLIIILEGRKLPAEDVSHQRAAVQAK